MKTDLNESLLGRPKGQSCRWPIAVVAGVCTVVGGVLLARRSGFMGGSEASTKPPSEPKQRLRIVNGCDTPIWIANFAGAVPYFPDDIRIEGGGSHDYKIPDEGLAATRFWPKWGCDDQGQNCRIGGSGGPGEGCIAAGCAPPVDSKFEASFGCTKSDPKDCAINPSDPTAHLGPEDWWDVSQVDGWTLPYKVEVFGECDAPRVIDCSKLSFDSCPKRENLGPKVGNQTLLLLDPSGSGEVVGCYSPCAKLSYSNWNQGYGFAPETPEAQNYCCPTPPIAPAQCSSGPVIRTAYVQAVHRLCPSVYAYAYDDGVGLSKCPAGTRYQTTFYCPS
tara:strand:+ start:423 stop:1421 length:999 start_codon:yes stop_codon:yes gene_type:complete